MYIQERYVDKTDGYMFGESDIYEPYTDNVEELFRSLQRDFGRCSGKVYIGEAQQIGWVFEKRMKYEDCNEYYLQEVWVTLHDDLPSHTTKYYYHKFN